MTMNEPQETPEDRLRSGLYGVYARWETIHRGRWGVTSLSTAMALEAVRALAEAYPDDPYYRKLLVDVQREADE